MTFFSPPGDTTHNTPWRFTASMDDFSSRTSLRTPRKPQPAKPLTRQSRYAKLTDALRRSIRQRRQDEKHRGSRTLPTLPPTPCASHLSRPRPTDLRGLLRDQTLDRDSVSFRLHLSGLIAVTSAGSRPTPATARCGISHPDHHRTQ